jgi:hypothetical protein
MFIAVKNKTIHKSQFHSTVLHAAIALAAVAGMLFFALVAGNWH